MKAQASSLLAIMFLSSMPCFAAPGKTTAPVSKEVVIDAVVASVDDKPITLSDLNTRLSPRRLSMGEASKDPEAMRALDQIITEKLMEEEAKVRRLNVGDNDVDDYIKEVAQRNGLSLGDFEAALAREGTSMKSYKQQVKMDIIKAKLTSSIIRGGVSITDAEVDEYIAKHPELKRNGNNIKLHHLVVSKQGRTPAELKTRLAQISEALEKGDNFIQVAQRMSDTGGTGGESLIGTIPLQDLSPTIAEVVSPLRAGESSAPIETPNDVQIFFVEERLAEAGKEDEEVDEEKLREEVRQLLQKQKTKERLAAFFKDDLYQNHAVEKRL